MRAPYSIQIEGPPSAAADSATMTTSAAAVHATSSRWAALEPPRPPPVDGVAGAERHGEQCAEGLARDRVGDEHGRRPMPLELEQAGRRAEGDQPVEAEDAAAEEVVGVGHEQGDRHRDAQGSQVEGPRDRDRQREQQRHVEEAEPGQGAGARSDAGGEQPGEDRPRRRPGVAVVADHALERQPERAEEDHDLGPELLPALRGEARPRGLDRLVAGVRRPQLEGGEVADGDALRDVVTVRHGCHGRVVEPVVADLGQVLRAEEEVVLLPRVDEAAVPAEAAQVEVGQCRRGEHDREGHREGPPPPAGAALEEERGRGAAPPTRRQWRSSRWRR